MPAIVEEAKRAAKMEVGDLAIEVVGKNIRVYELTSATKLKSLAYSDTFMGDRLLHFIESNKVVPAKDFTVARLYRKPENARKIIARYFPKYSAAGGTAHLYYSGRGPRGLSVGGGEGYFSIRLSGPLEALDEAELVLRPGTSEEIRLTVERGKVTAIRERGKTVPVSDEALQRIRSVHTPATRLLSPTDRTTWNAIKWPSNLGDMRPGQPFEYKGKHYVMLFKGLRASEVLSVDTGKVVDLGLRRWSLVKPVKRVVIGEDNYWRLIGVGFKLLSEAVSIRVPMEHGSFMVEVTTEFVAEAEKVYDALTNAGIHARADGRNIVALVSALDVQSAKNIVRNALDKSDAAFESIEETKFDPAKYVGPKYKVGDRVQIVRRFGWKKGYKPVPIKPPVVGVVKRVERNPLHLKGPPALTLEIDPDDYGRASPKVVATKYHRIMVHADEVEPLSRGESTQSPDPTFEQVARIISKAKGAGFKPGRITLNERFNSTSVPSLRRGFVKQSKSPISTDDYIFIIHHEEEDTYSVAHSVHDNPRLGYQELQTGLSMKAANIFQRKMKARWKAAKVRRFLVTGQGHKREFLPEAVSGRGEARKFVDRMAQKHYAKRKYTKAEKAQLKKINLAFPGEQVSIDAISLLSTLSASNEEKRKRIIAAVGTEVKDPSNKGLTIMQILRHMFKDVDEGKGWTPQWTTTPGTPWRLVDKEGNWFRERRKDGMWLARMFKSPEEATAFVKSSEGRKAITAFRRMRKRDVDEAGYTYKGKKGKQAQAWNAAFVKAAEKLKSGSTKRSEDWIHDATFMRNSGLSPEAAAKKWLSTKESVDEATTITPNEMKMASLALLKKIRSMRWEEMSSKEALAFATKFIKGKLPKLSQKQAEQIALVTLNVFVGEDTAEARAKVIVRKPKEEVNYRRAEEDRDGDNRCANCAFIILPDECKRVRGKIDQDFTCDLWKRGVSEDLDEAKNYNRPIDPEKWGVSMFMVAPPGRSELHVMLPPDADDKLRDKIINSVSGQLITKTGKKMTWLTKGRRFKQEMVAKIIRGWKEKTGWASESIDEAAAQGKVQAALLNFVKQLPPRSEHALADVAKRQEFRGVHFRRLMTAAAALAKKKLIQFDGFSNVSPI